MAGQPPPTLPGDGTLFDSIYGGGASLVSTGMLEGTPFPLVSWILVGLWLVPALVYFAFDRVARQATKVVEACAEAEEDATDEDALAEATPNSNPGKTGRGGCADVVRLLEAGGDIRPPPDLEACQHEEDGPRARSGGGAAPGTSGKQPGSGDAGGTPHDALRKHLLVLYSSLEFRVPGVDGAKAKAGGLGTVTDLISRHHPTDIIMVHPMMKQTHGIVEEDEPLRLVVDGREELVRVFHHVAFPQGTGGPRMVFLILSHALFQQRSCTEEIYPSPMTRRGVLRFWCLWNKAVGALIVRHRPQVFHCPDFHSAVAPWYARHHFAHFRMLLVLHNVEYQGQINTDMIIGRRLRAMAALWDLPGEPEQMLRRHLVYKGRFNMLKAAVDFIAEHQHGFGCCAVSAQYAYECHHAHSILWRLPRVFALDNPMLEDERPQLQGRSLQQQRDGAKAGVQKQYGLEVNPDARIFVFLGRLVRQKGVDVLADVVPWILETFPLSQIIVIGPVGDGFGNYARVKLERLAEEPRFSGRVYVRCEFLTVGPELKYACDFCLMPSRDEPFGYVDIEFAWHGAVLVGAQAGGLGKVPGFYYVAQNRDNLGQLRAELRGVVRSAMSCPAGRLGKMSAQGARTKFPLARWERKLLQLYSRLAPGGAPAELADDHLRSGARGSDAVVAVSTPGVEPSAGGAAQIPAEAGPEFLTQELSESELTLRVQALIKADPGLNIKQIMERIGCDLNLELEKASPAPTRWLLRRACGVYAVDVLVSLGYVTSSLVDTLAIVQATEWANRINYVGNGPPDHIIPMRLFSCTAAGYAVGAPVWTGLCRRVAPRVLLGSNMLLRLVFVLSILPLQPNLGYAMLLAAANGFVASGGILFVVFNFMMSIKADFTQIAVRLGSLEMGRYCLQWFVLSFVFLANPTAVAGQRGSAITWELGLTMLPLAVLSAVMIVAPAALLFYAPGPYRDDRFPGLDLSVFLKKPSFLFLCLSDLLGALISFPAALYITWWLLQGWSVPDLAWISAVVGVSCAVGMGVLAAALSASPRSGIVILVSVTLLLAPPSILRAFVQSQVSTDMHHGTSQAALAISILSLVLEGVRTSAIWTARLRMLKDRWRFLSYSALLLTCTHLVKAASPWACEEFVSMYSHASFGHSNQRRLAQAIEYVTVFPGMIALAQYLAQFSAAHFINKDMEVARGAMHTEELSKWWRRLKIAKTTITWAMGLASLALIAGVAIGADKHTDDQELRAPVRPCSLGAVPRCELLGDLAGPGEAVYGTASFGPNRFGQNTTGRANCFREMQRLGGDTFVFWPSGRCLVQRCGAAPSANETAGPLHPPGQVWSTHCDLREARLVSVQLFEWRWGDIAAECEGYLGPAGFRAVHVQPPAEHILGPGWSTRYQPVSYKLDSRSGTAEEFAEMVRRCQSAGVAIMVDAVINHMATTLKRGWSIENSGFECRDSDAGCVGFAGTRYESRAFADNHAGIDRYMPSDFHHKFGDLSTNCGWPPWGNDRYNCDMRSLPDLDTESARVRLMISRYLFGLFELGITHLRIDAAGSIYSESLQQILYHMPLDYVVQEYYPEDLPLQWSSLQVGHVTDLEYGVRVAGSGALFDDYSQGGYVDTSHRFGELLRVGSGHVTPEGQALIFLANHDSERERWQDNTSSVDGSYCSYPRGGERGHKCVPIYKHGLQFRLAQLFMLAWPYGRTLRLLSSYTFFDFDGGPPLESGADPARARSLPVGHGGDPAGYPARCKGTPAASPMPADEDRDPGRPWVCQHRWRGVAGMVRFRNEIAGYSVEDVRHVFDDRSGHLAYSIGHVAFVALSRGWNEFTGHGSNATFNLTGLQTGMPMGAYCNLAEFAGGPSLQNSTACAEMSTIRVRSDGAVASGVLPGGGLVAIHRNHTALGD